MAYAQRAWNQPAMSLGVICSSAVPRAPLTVWVVRAPTDRRNAFTFEPSSSTGVRSGLYTGKGSTRAPTALIAASTGAFWCGCKLSHTTTSPGCNSGTNTSGTYVPNAAPSVAPSNTNGATTSVGRSPTIMVTFFHAP